MKPQIGQPVRITETRVGIQQYTVERNGQVIQVCQRFAAVDNGRFVECVWIDKDEKNNPVLECICNK